MTPEAFSKHVVGILQRNNKISSTLLPRFKLMFIRYLDSMSGQQIRKEITNSVNSLSFEVGSMNPNTITHIHNQALQITTPKTLQSTCDALFIGQMEMQADISELKAENKSLKTRFSKLENYLALKDKRLLFTDLTTLVVWIGMEMFPGQFYSHYFSNNSSEFRLACRELDMVVAKLNSEYNLELEASLLYEHIAKRADQNTDCHCNPTKAAVEAFLEESLLVLNDAEIKLKDQLLKVADCLGIKDLKSKERIKYLFESSVVEEFDRPRKRHRSS